VFGVFEPLAVGARVPAVVAGSYGVEKVFGASNKEAAMSALTPTAYSPLRADAGAQRKN